MRNAGPVLAGGAVALLLAGAGWVAVSESVANTRVEAAARAHTPPPVGLADGVSPLGEHVWPDGLTATVSASRFYVEALNVPGDPTDAGVVVSVQVVNGGQETVSLDAAELELRAAGLPTLAITPAEEPLSGPLRPGEAQVGSWSFVVPPHATGALRAVFDPTLEHAAHKFTGGL